MSEPLEVGIFGAGKLGQLLLDCLEGDTRWICNAFYDEQPREDTIQNLPVLHSDMIKAGAALFMAVGDPVMRRNLVAKLADNAIDWKTYVDRRAMVGTKAEIGQGALVLPFAMVASGVALGTMTYVSAYAHIGTGSRIGAYSSVLAGASIGETIIGEDCIIGLKSVCLDGADIGSGSVVGPMALVRKTVPAGSLATGNPARVFQRGAEQSSLRSGRPL